jgi:hypothetical protein
MKTHTKCRIISISVLAALLIFYANMAFAQSGFEIYIFGQNIKSFQNSNWLKVAAGAFASVCIHELGHALYLECMGKSWNFKASASSGFSVYTDENLTKGQLSNYGRAGFALQTFIGTGLTLFKATRHSDFTKGWVGMNAVQIVSYQGRRHKIDDDFELIERGGGNSGLEFGALSFLSINNFMRLENGFSTLLTKAEPAPDFELSYDLSDDLSESEGDGQDEFASTTGRPPAWNIPSGADLPLVLSRIDLSN